MKRVLVLLLTFSLLLICGCSSNDTTTKKGKAYELVNGKPSYQRVDINLASMNGTIAYSQVYDMITNPGNYENKVVKMKGQFSVYQNQDKTIFYPACVIKDATACCAQGIEFVLYGNPPYPTFYPDQQEEITVIGIFKIYYEGSQQYSHLIDSVILS